MAKNILKLNISMEYLKSSLRNLKKLGYGGKPYNINVYYQNVNGIRSKLREIQLAFSSCVHDIVLLSETNLTLDTGDSELGAHGSNVFRKDRSTDTSCKRSGGVLIATRNELFSFCILTSIENIECLMVSCSIKPYEKILVCGAYISPNSATSQYSDFCTAVEEAAASDTFSNVFIAGDFNLPDVPWSAHHTNSLPASHPLTDLINTYELTQINYIRNFHGVILDLIFVNCTSAVASHATAPWIAEDCHHPALEIDLPLMSFHPADVKYIPNFKRCDTHGVYRGLVAAELIVPNQSTI